MVLSITRTDKKQYDGTFKNSNRHGNGTYWDCHGRKIYSGGWKSNQFHNKGKYYHSDEKAVVCYDGYFKEGIRHGPGRLFNQNGRLVYNGGWKMGKKHGMAKIRIGHAMYYKMYKDGAQVTRQYMKICWSLKELIRYNS